MHPIFESITIVENREDVCDCFILFRVREAAANVMTVDEIDPCGKIPRAQPG
jgi:formate dehydrogenase major subunit